MQSFSNLIKLALAVLFLVCLADMPYGFYQLVRFLALVGFVVLAYDSYQAQRSVEVVVYLSLAVLFQPFVKIALGRTLWNVVDVIVAAALVISIFSTSKINSSK